MDRQHFRIRGPRLEFHPFKLEHHNQYKCLIKSKQSNDILRTITFDTYSNIYEKNDKKPKVNLTIDVSRLIYNDELRLICQTGLFYFQQKNKMKYFCLLYFRYFKSISSMVI